MKDRKTLIAVPAMDMCPVPFAYSLATLRRDAPSRISVISGAAVYEARNELAREALAEGCGRVLWIDSDMVFPDDTMIRLGADLDAGYDMVCGIFFKRRLPVAPVIYRSVEEATGRCEVFADYPRDSLFEVAGCGFGAVMMKAELLTRAAEEGGLGPFTPLPGLSEDLSFCVRAVKAGARIGCDSRVKIGHAGQIVYGEGMYRRSDT